MRRIRTTGLSSGTSGRPSLAFRRNFRQATALWLVCLVMILFFAAYYRVVQSLGGSYGKIYQVTFYMLALVFLFGFLYVFPLQARYVNTVRNTLRNAWLLSVAALPWTVLNILLVAAAVYISFFMNPGAVDLFVYLWGACGFALIAYLQSFLFRRAFQKLDPAVMQRKSLRAEGSVFTDEEHRDAVFYISFSLSSFRTPWIFTSSCAGGVSCSIFGIWPSTFSTSQSIIRIWCGVRISPSAIRS